MRQHVSRQVIDSMERALEVSDPRLTAKFAGFARLSAGEPIHAERLPQLSWWRHRRWLLWLVTMAALLVCLICAIVFSPSYGCHTARLQPMASMRAPASCVIRPGPPAQPAHVRMGARR